VELGAVEVEELDVEEVEEVDAMSEAQSTPRAHSAKE
jgi:hypothetical protein